MMKPDNMKIKNKHASIKRTAQALLLATAFLSSAPAHSGMPVIDYAALADRVLEAVDRATVLANWVTQLQNWQQTLKNWIRGQMEQIPGIKKMLDAQEKKQIQQMFAKRKERCRDLSSTSSIALCLRTVDLEEKKYNILVEMDEKISREFHAINTTISRQNRQAQAGNSNQASTAEQEVLKKLEILNVTLSQYKNELESIDRLIEQYKWARINLSKDQLLGKSKGSGALTKSITAVALQKNAADYRKKAATSKRTSTGISNQF